MDKRIFIALVLVLAVVSVLLFGSFYKEARDTAITKLNEEQAIHAEQAARGIEDFFATWIRNLNSLSKMDAIIDNDAVGKLSLKHFYEANQGQIRAIVRLDERGVILYNFPSIRAVGTDISNQKHVRELLGEHKPVVSDVFRAVEGFDSVALHVPVFRGSKFKGSIGILIDFESVASRYLDVIKIGETGYAWVISRDGTLLYSPVPGTTGKSVFESIKDYPLLVAMANDMLRGHEGTALYTFDRIGDRNVGQTKKYAVYMPVHLGNTFWSVAVASSEKDVLSGLISFRNKLVFVIGAIFVCGMVFSTLGAKAWLIVKEAEKRRETEHELRESEERLRLVLEANSEGVWDWNIPGGQAVFSPRYSGMLGYESDEFPKSYAEWKKLVHPDDFEAVNTAHAKHINEGKEFCVELRMRKKSGEWCWILSRGMVVERDAEGRALRMVGTHLDITERKQMERQLENRLNFEKLLTIISTHFISMPADCIDDALISAQRQICEYLGVDICNLWQFSPDQPENFFLTHYHVRPDFHLELPLMMKADESFPWCLEMMINKEVIVLPRVTDAPAEAARDLESWKQYGVKSALTFPLFAGDGSSFGALGFNTLKEEREWSEELINKLEIVSQIFASALNRKFIEKNLRESEARLRLATDAANVGVWAWEFETGQIWATERSRMLYGFSSEEKITYDQFLSVILPDDRDRVMHSAEQALQEGAGFASSYRIVLPEGSIHWIKVRGKVFLKPSGEPDRMMGVSIDISEQKLAEAALEESRAQIAAVMNSTKDFIWSVDPERFGLLTWNRAFRDYFFEQRGIEIEVGMAPEELVPPDYVSLWHSLFSRALREEFVVTEYVVVSQTKTLLLSLHTMSRDHGAFGISVFGRDITELKAAEAARLENMARYQAVVEAFDGLLYICSQDYRVEFMNQHMIERTGRNAVGELCYKALHNSESVCEWCVNDRVLQGETVRWEVQSPKDHRWYYVVNTPIHHADGTVSKQAMIMDISDRKLAEEELRAEKNKLQSIMSAVNSGITIRNLNYDLTYQNDYSLNTFGKHLGDKCYSVFAGIDRVCDGCPVEKAFQDGQSHSHVKEVEMPAGEITFWENTAVPMKDDDGNIYACLEINNNITERKNSEKALIDSEAALRISQKDLQKLAGRLISAQEEELRRLSRELHDDLTQRLAVLAIEAGKIELDLGKKTEACPEISRKISEMKDQLIGVSEDVHAISRQLHPTILDDLGLVRAIESECAALMRRENIEIIFNKEDVPLKIDNDIALCIYRVLQESLKNVISHSRAASCEIYLKGADDKLCLTVSDGGVGFDSAMVRHKAGLGLSSMRERAQLVQGDFSINSRPGQGTLIRIQVPLQAGDA